MNRFIKASLIWASLLSILSTIWLGAVEAIDTFTYVNAWDSICHRNIDIWRTPLYPLLIGIAKTIAGNESFAITIVVIQHILSVLSIYFFYRAVFLILNREKESRWATIVYLLFIYTTGWNNVLMTESLATSLSVIFIWSFTQFSRRQTLSQVSTLIVISIMLLMLRPSFVYIVPVLWTITIYYLLKSRHKQAGRLVLKKGLILGGVSSTLTIIIAGYVMIFHSTFGIYAMSCVNTFNNYYIGRSSGLIEPHVVDNLPLRNDLEQSLKSEGKYLHDDSKIWEEVNMLVDRHSLVEVNRAISASIRENRIGWCRQIAVHIYHSAVDYRITSSWQTLPLHRICLLIYPHMAFLYLLLIYCLVNFLLSAYRRQNSPINATTALLFLMIVSNITVDTIGAKDDFDRLLVPSLPLIILLTTKLIAHRRRSSSLN